MDKLNLDIKNIFSKSLNIIFIVSLICIIAFGVILRTHAWIYASQLYSDESCILANAISKGFLGAFLPQDYAQCTPPILLLLTKIIYSTFGLNEIALRSSVYGYSIATLFVFSILSFKIFKNKITILTAMFILVVSPRLIYFTSVLKQYTGDAFFSVFILLIAMYLKDKKISNILLVILGLLSAFCVLASYSSVFLIFIMSIILAIYKFKKNKSVQISSLLCFLVPFGTIMTIFFFVNCLPTIQNEVLQSSWSNNIYCYNTYFFPEHFSQSLDYFRFFNCTGEIFKDYVEGYTFFNIYLSAVAIIFSCILLFKNEKFLFFSLTTPFVLAMMLGFFHLYPFSPERIIIYLIPQYIIILVKPLDYCSFDKKTLSVIILIFYSILINFDVIYKYSGEFLNEFEHVKVATAKTFINFLYKSDITPNDYIFISSVNDMSFVLYDKEKRFERNHILVDTFIGLEALENMPVNSNVYIYYENRHIDFERIANWMKEKSKKIYQIDGYKYSIYKCKKLQN